MRRRIRSLLTFLVTASCCLGAVAWLASSERTVRENDLRTETQLVADQVSGRLRGTLEKYVLALNQVASFFENSDTVTESEFYSYSAGTLNQIPACLRISHVDSSLRIREVYPPGPNRALIGIDTHISPIGRAAAVRAMETKQPVFSPPMPLLDGPRGFILFVPIHREGRFVGGVAGTFRGVDFIQSLVVPALLARYDEIVLDSGKSLLPGPAETLEAPSDRPVVSVGFNLAGAQWQVVVSPREEVVADRLRSGQKGFWTMGAILALLAGAGAGLTVHYASALAARFRTQGEALAQVRQRLDGAREQLIQAEKLSALGELVAGVAHELNNPLAAIMGYVQLLQTRELPDDVQRRLETVCAEAERMARIVKNLLTFARKHPPEKRYLGLNAIIEKTLELKAYHFRANQIVVTSDLQPDLPDTLLDFHQIQQVLINLFNNAEQAMLEAGKGGRLELRTRAEGGRIQVRVSDSGPGMSEGVATRVFEPFFTTKKEGKGTGLGLSMCYGIMHEHAGSIRVESRPGHGATFILDFPIVEPPDGPAEEAETAADEARRLKILVVDDEQAVSDFLVEFLTSRGHRVNTASDVPEALAKIADENLDVIISDMSMPNGTGLDIYRAVLLTQPPLARRIVFTSGSGTTPETREFLRDTGSPFVPKPFAIGELDKAIEKATARAEAQATPGSRSSSAG